MARTHPKLNTQKGMGITSNWQHGFICACNFQNWFPDMQMIYWMEKVQQVMKGKEDRRKFQGESKVENRLRIERRGIEKRSRVLKKKGEKENKLQTLRSLRLMDVPLQDRVHQQLIGLKKSYKEINCKLSPTPSHEEVGYAFIVTRGGRPNTYPMDSAHQRYRHIHYFCLIHLNHNCSKAHQR